MKKRVKKWMEKWRSLGQNDRIILRNTTAAFAVKGAALVVSFLTTPAFIRYFNDNAVLGVWYTVLSVLLWCLNFDLGIGNGLRNNLVRDLGEGNRRRARETISAGMFSTAATALFLGGVGTALIFLIDPNGFYNIASDTVSGETLRVASLLVLLAILLRFFLTTVSAVFYALQKSSVNNFLALLVSILQWLFVLVFRFDTPEESLLALAAGYVVISNLPAAAAGVWVFSTRLRDCRPRLRYVKREAVKRVMGIGLLFFGCQIFYMLLVNTDTVLITNLFGPAYATEYSFYHRIGNLPATIVTLALTPVWSVVTKAQTEGNYVWLKRLYRTLKLSALPLIFLQFAIVPVQQIVMDLWLGENSIDVRWAIALAFAVFESVFVYTGLLSTMACGLSRMRLQFWFYGGAALLKLILVPALCGIGDWSIVIWIDAAVLLPYCVAQQIDLDRRIDRLIAQNK